MTAILDFFGGPWFSAIGSAASIVSLAVTVYVARTVWKVERRFLGRARLPEQTRALKRHVDELATILNEFDTRKTEVAAVAAKCRAVVESMRGKLDRTLQSKAERTLAALDQAARGANKDMAWDAHAQILGFVASIEEAQKDAQWVNER